MEKAEAVAGKLWQSLALLCCAVLAILMILNTQMGGEAMWFWYGTVFRHGAKLYSDLHTALQPLFVEETATWMRLFGPRIAVYEIPSLIHACILAFGIYLVLRESDWPDWQKAIVLFGVFVFTVSGHSYRFDDYHVLAEAQILYALLLLLILGRRNFTCSARREAGLVALLGFVCGLTVVTRLTDGAAIVVASGISLLFVLKRRKLAGLALFAVVAGVTVIVVVKLTGDTFSAYVANSIFRAAGSKGGTGSIMAAPLRMIGNTLAALNGEKKIALYLVLIIGLGALLAKYWRHGVRYTIPLQFALAAILFLITSPLKKEEILQGRFYEFLVLFLTTIMYAVAAVVFLRFAQSKRDGRPWDPRQILILIPILEWASYSAGAAAEPLTNYYAPVALLLLLIPVLEPFRRYAIWANPSVITVMALVAISGCYTKAVTPYSWQNYKYPPMFTHREWYHHPLYGEMYIDDDLLHFSRRVCSDIGAVPGTPQPALLSLPYPYPNYFCGTPPWHNYVQTFFDTATRGTVEHMMQELETNPPQWIVYQRQLNIMQGAERLYNHGKPLAQRDLDTMILRKIASGQWTLVDQSNYLSPPEPEKAAGAGWFIIRTKP